MKAPIDIDALLNETPRTDGASLERALASARGELALREPVRRWRTEAAWLMASSGGLAMGVAGVMLASGALTGSALLERVPLLLLLLATSAVCAWGALSPRGHGLRRGGVGLAMACAATLVLARGSPSTTPSLPAWVCTVSHLAVGAAPLVVALWMLRGAAFQPLRALSAGLSVGTTGAFVGELACEQDWRHVASYHLFAWGLICVMALVLSRHLKPRSYAP
ncbi:DUF1109 domain-containing protein [Myxococcus llanfairpwllgwyngyllgogerychwyrndrobwllllantysiliogogogochensis]|uniref:DUF1109 domain-containing protein n=1 Tax=Myxococcus llanfairpwllgwyngyllgogerychwyrndrobwllllantysiliogogogochensis TaxID=2590453 RepID=A0A540WJD2_9BACT|nr:DUF1109 domain-containing protein [Myxococcus llanfairpwllgwyngyllgogerychwyrndrobwllllantysiliogogogochensis]TQF09132.1 DUF1109 domain-containing protein [Myxococcus llanfairpwllgwyngyllgogerychwyrndrobwllllantysiliogogogochensis]